MLMEPAVAFLANGKLFLQRPGGQPGEVESRFAQELIDQAIRSFEKNEWKTRSATGQLMSGRGLLGGPGGGDPTSRRIRFTGLARTNTPGAMLYSLDTEAVGGLFLYDISEEYEQRLFHNQRFRARHLAPHPRRDLVAFSLRSEDGAGNIALVETNGQGLQLVTEGDSLDEAPSWVAGAELKLVFQSAGLGRTQQGHVAGIGPCALQLLDLERGHLETLAEDGKTDFLAPRLAADGTLYYIRRPYQAHRAPRPIHLLRDVVLLPVRLVWALLSYLNFFSTIYSGKPLMSAGGPQREGPDPKQVMLWGRMVDAERAMRAAKAGEPAALVPKDWELVQRNPQGKETVLAESVISFDLSPDGRVVYTNGGAVFRREPDGRRELLCEGKMIEHVVLTG